MATTFRDLSLIAELHYGKLPDAFKAKASEFFDALDLDGDGAVTLPELLNSNLEGKFGAEFIQHVFYNLDEDGKGHLAFRECLTLYYLCMYSSRTCHACERNIPHGLGYTCLKCWKEGTPPNNQFSVCLECFSSLNYQHEHGPLHLLHDFVLFDNLLHSRPSAPASPAPAPIRTIEQTTKQCIVCGDHHESGARGFMCDVHMSRMRDSTEFVCEWCFSYLCSKCGNLFRDSTTRAEPGKWLQRFVCPSCHQNNVTTDSYDASLKRLQVALGNAELLRHCKTCEIKQRNGTLFWIVNGTNTAPAVSANPQSRAPAAANVRSRNGSFDNEQQSLPQNYVNRMGSGGSGRAGGSGEASSRGGSSHGGSLRGGRGGPINRMSMQDAPPPRGAPVNRVNMQDISVAAVSAIRSVNRMVNAGARAANLLNGIGGGGGGNNNSDGGMGGEGESGSCDMGGGGGSTDSSGLLASLSSLVGSDTLSGMNDAASVDVSNNW